jgi:dUTP pyrophosphatase
MDKPNLGVALINIKNVFRSLVGLPKQFPVKVVRSAEAKQYKLMQISKAGDVGYNLPSIKALDIPAPTELQRKQYAWHTDRAQQYEALGKHDLAEIHRKRAMDALPKAIIPTGIKLEMPNNLWCSIEARSSSSSKMLITPDSIIDAGYRGELFAVVYNFGYTDYHVSAGEMLVQVIFHERIVANIQEVDELSASDRGETGFGSSGAIADKVGDKQ